MHLTAPSNNDDDDDKECYDNDDDNDNNNDDDDDDDEDNDNKLNYDESHVQYGNDDVFSVCLRYLSAYDAPHTDDDDDDDNYDDYANVSLEDYGMNSALVLVVND